MTPATPRKPRSRPPTLRERNAGQVRDALLGAAVALLERREQPTMRAVAAAAGVGERTIYRYFSTHDELAAACAEKLQGRAGVPLCSEVSELEDYARRLFETFEANAALVEAVLTLVRGDLARTRRNNLDAMAAVLSRAFPRATAADRAAAAASLRTTLSGSGWFYQRHSCGLPQQRVIENARWLIRTVLSELRRSK